MPSPPHPSRPPLACHSRQRRSWTPESQPLRLYGMERFLRLPLPELSRNQVLCSALWQLILRGLGLPCPRTEGQAPILLCVCVCVCVCVMAWLKRCSVLSLSPRWGTSTGLQYLRSHKHSRAIGFCFCFCFSFMSIPFRVQCLPLGRFAWSTLLLITVSFQCAWISCEMVSLGIPRYRGSQGEPRKDSALQK